MEKLQCRCFEGESDSQGSKSMEWESHISADEEDLIIRLHRLLGDRWALIAGRLPWRTTEEIERFWRMKISHDSSESSD